MDKTILQKNMKYTLLSVAFGCASILALLIIFSFIVTKVTASNMLIDAAVMLSTTVGGFVAGFLNASWIRKNGIYVGLISGGALCLIMFLLKLMFFGALPSGITFVKLLFLLVGAVIGGISGVNIKRKNKFDRISR